MLNPDSPVDELASLRREMLKFARLQLRDDASAEDAVQEALAAALVGQKQFNNRAQLKTWVFAILKNKIIDIIRERVRSPGTAMVVDEIPEDAYDDLFNEKGYWQTIRPSSCAIGNASKPTVLAGFESARPPAGKHGAAFMMKRSLRDGRNCRIVDQPDEPLGGAAPARQSCALP